MRLVQFLLLVVGLCSARLGPRAHAVLFAATDDPAFNTTPPTGEYAASGWNFQGQWANFLGTPIASQYFITAEHVGGVVGEPFVYQGATYITDAFYDDPETDLRICHVTTPFPSWAELYAGNAEFGAPLVLFGRGTRRGSEVTFAGEVAGWNWGPSDGVMRWGTNQVSGVENFGPGQGQVLAAEFNFGLAIPSEAQLSVGDSGGGLFIRDLDGTWRLAGINFSVSGPYHLDVLGTGRFNAALFDQAGFFVEVAPGVFEIATGPGEFYATRISSRRDFIENVTGVPEPSATLLVLGTLAMVGVLRRHRR